MERSIAGLNQTIWYRGMKVVYFLSLLFFLVAPPVGIFLDYTPEFDNINSYLLCKDGRQMYLKENNITLNNGYISSNDDEELKHICLSDAEIGRAIRTRFPDNKYIGLSNEEIGASEKKSFSAKFATYSIRSNTENYTLVSKYEERNWFATIGYSVMSIIVTLLSFEAMRRIFYYIFLGSLWSKK